MSDLISVNVEAYKRKIAEDAIAFVINNENADTTMTVEKMKSNLHCLSITRSHII